jgi:hypothetical protein
VTGRPDYELLPYDKLASIATVGLLNGRPEGVDTRISGFRSDRPLTEIVYRSTTAGLQKASVTHAQTRSGPGGAPLQYLFAYAGSGSRGEYDGSRLQRKRQILLRIKRDTPGLSLEIGEMFNRHRVGAHGGVQPFSGFGYESIYQRLGATVKNESAVRQTSRNDLWLRAELPGRGAWAKLWWTVGTLTHRLIPDTTVARVSRVGIKVGQPILANDALHVSVSAFRDGYPERNAWSRAPSSRFEITALASGSNQLGPALISWSAGVSTLGSGTGETAFEPAYAADLEWASGAMRPFLRSRRGLRPYSASDVFGFGGTVVPSQTARTGRQSLDEVGISIRFGSLRVETSLFAAGTVDGLVRTLDAGGDTLSIVPYSGSRFRVGGTARVGLRESTRRGLYAWVQGTASTTQGDDPTLDRLIGGSLPAQFGAAAFGVRGLLFQDDLDGDLSIRVRGWSAHRGLRFHPQTGLLALPDPDSRPVANSFVLDLVGIARVRTATLTISLENFLSGTTLVPGNQLVPDYPYPARRLRFSVFWPILD